MTLTLEQVKNWLKFLDPALKNKIAVGCTDAGKDYFIGVYNDKRGGGFQRICLGGTAATRFQSKRISILIHWSKKATEAEGKAIELYEKLYGLSHFQIGTVSVVSIDPGAAPISAGKDENGIYEYVINATITYERNEK